MHSAKKLDNYEPRFTEMEEALTDHSDRLTSLEKRVEKLQQENKELTEKTDDLENRSRRNNLRVMGLPEGYEGGAVSAFMSKFLVDLLQDDSFKTARQSAPDTEGQADRRRETTADHHSLSLLSTEGASTDDREEERTTHLSGAPDLYLS